MSQDRKRAAHDFPHDGNNTSSDADEKTQIVQGTTYHYSSAWTRSLELEEHWCLYWQQQKLMANQIDPGQHVLEIGHGSGFTANYLRSKGIRVTTLDIDAAKCPDIVANIVTFDWTGMSFDHILAFQVFEHIPFAEFSDLLPKLSKVCSGQLFMSLPKSERVLLHLEVRLPIIGTRTLHIATARRKIIEKHHFWELGIGLTERELKALFKNSGFSLCEKHIKLSRVFLRLQPFEKS